MNQLIICIVVSVIITNALGFLWYRLGYIKGHWDGWKDGYKKASSLLPTCLEIMNLNRKRFLLDE